MQRLVTLSEVLWKCDNNELSALPEHFKNTSDYIFSECRRID